MARQVVVLLDPHHPYAGRFAQICDRVWGLDTVCLYTGTTPWDRARATRYLPRASVVGHYAADRDSLESAADELRRRHDVVAVIPHLELYVEEAITLAEALGITWADPVDLRRFRDKSALKEHVRKANDGPRVNATSRVATLADIRSAQAQGPYERFVLKPNDGMNNNRIGFFTAASTDAEIQRYLGTTEGLTLVMEEFLDGEEYCVNGQVDAEGQVSTLVVYRTHHGSANGRTNLAARFDTVRRDSPVFEQAASYAAQVLTAAGLRRSPFHMELIIDATGPCLVEVGARLAGVGMAYDVAIAHAGSVDAFELATQHYLGRPPVRAQAPDWDAYDSATLRTICGISHAKERIADVHGLAEVEALPEFARWVSRPYSGQGVRPTVDLASSPWQVTVTGPSPEHLDEVERRIRREVGWNRSALTGARTLRRARVAATLVSGRLRLLPDVARTRPTSIGRES